MENVLEIANLNKKYENFELKNINLDMPKGVIIGVVGQNGAGKTTTIKAILNIIKRDSGKIKIFGKDNIKYEKEIKEEIGVVFDDSFLSEFLTPTDINKIMKNIYNNWDEKLYFEYLEKFSIPKKKSFKEFSSGMKMKEKIIVALSHHPKFLVLDEPTSGLDPIVRNDVLDIFQEFIQNDEHSILVSTHITSDLEHIADYITFISDGEVVFIEEKDKLIEEYGVAKCSEEEFSKIEKSDYIKYRKNKYGVEILTDNKKNFKEKYNLETIDKATIEEIMLFYVRGEE